jgi:DNA-binding response OmpR family regulator
MTHKILIVDDDSVIREILEFNLLNEGFEITCAVSAEDALDKMTAEYSLILLDVMMAGMSGYKFAETLRRKGNKIPVIFLTAKDTENDMLTGFSVGGDDYISKPFSIKEVIARVKAVLKRQRIPDKFIMNDFILDFNLKELSINDKKIDLTKTEYKILSFLIQNQGRIISRDEMINDVWKETPFITERTVDVHITRLRKKLGEHASLIVNQPGFGYRFNASNL